MPLAVRVDFTPTAVNTTLALTLSQESHEILLAAAAKAGKPVEEYAVDLLSLGARRTLLEPEHLVISAASRDMIRQLLVPAPAA